RTSARYGSGLADDTTAKPPPSGATSTIRGSRGRGHGFSCPRQYRLRCADDPGSVVAGRVVVEKSAGRGAVGALFRALDRVTGERVALKTVLAPERMTLERFRREALLLAELGHPAIVRHVAHGDDGDEGLWLAMEWLDGEDLKALIARGPLPVE